MARECRTVPHRDRRLKDGELAGPIRRQVGHDWAIASSRPSSGEASISCMARNVAARTRATHPFWLRGWTCPRSGPVRAAARCRRWSAVSSQSRPTRAAPPRCCGMPSRPEPGRAGGRRPGRSRDSRASRISAVVRLADDEQRLQHDPARSRRGRGCRSSCPRKSAAVLMPPLAGAITTFGNCA